MQPNFLDNFILCDSRDDKNKTISAKEYLNKIRPHSKDIRNELKRKCYTWEIQSMRAINFMSSKYNDGECIMNSRSENIELLINYEEDEVIEELFQSLLSKY